MTEKSEEKGTDTLDNGKSVEGGKISNEIIDLKKEIAGKYIDELKSKKESSLTGLIIGKGNSLKNYLVSENIGDKVLDTIKGSIMDAVFNKIDGQSFVVDGVTYASIFDYLKPVKEKIDKANTKAELDALATTILTTPVVVEPSTINNNQEHQFPEDKEIQRNEYIYPLPGAKITSPVGSRKIEGVHGGEEHIHKGIDISTNAGTSILSIAQGTIDAVGFGGSSGFSGYGNYMVVKLPDGKRVLYGHMEKFPEKSNGVRWKIGDDIKAGEQVGLVGSTGMSTGPHLHMEIREGKPDDTVDYFSRQYLDPIAVLPITKDMLAENIIDRVDQSVLLI